MLSCRNITDQASDYLDGRMNWWQRMKFRMHLKACVHCDRFIRQLKMTIGYSAKVSHQCASEEEVAAVLARIRAAQNTQSQSS